MEYLIFFSIVAAVGGLIWFGARWVLKKEAEIIAKDNAAWELAKRDLQAFQQEVATTVEKKAVEVEQAVVKQVAKATKRKAKK